MSTTEDPGEQKEVTDQEKITEHRFLEERTRKMTEDGKSNKYELYEKSFRSLKRTSTYIRQLMSDSMSLDVIRDKYSKWMFEYENYIRLHSELRPNISPVELEHFDIEHEEQEVYLRDFKSEVQDYHVTKERYSGSKVTLSKSGSRRSVRSSSTVMSAKRIKEETKILELSAIKKAITKKREIEIAKLKLKFEEDELNIDTDLEISNAKSELYKKLEQEDSEQGSIESGHLSQNKLSPYASSFIPRESQEQFVEPLPVSSVNFCADNDNSQNVWQPTSTIKDSGNEQRNVENCSLSPQRPDIVNYQQSTASETKVRQPNSDTTSADKNNNVTTTNSAGNEMNAIKSVVMHLRKPVPEIRKFGGNPMEYRRFIRQFNAKVVPNTENDDERMNYLEQLTYGDANKVVSGFSHLSGERGYKAAMKRLEERYGDDEVIVTAFIKKALQWPAVKDAKGIDDFSLFLTECENAAESIGQNSVLDYSENIKQLVMKLPIYMHDRWRNIVIKSKDEKKTVKFSDFVLFVQREAKKSNDATYGALSLSDSKPRQQIRIGNIQQRQPVLTVATLNKDDDKEVSAASLPKTELKCSLCEEAHRIEDCKTFVSLSLQDRYKHLKERGICYGCLKRGHMVKKCRSRSKCDICGKRHPTLLHDNTRAQSQQSTRTKEIAVETSNAAVPITCIDTGAGISDFEIKNTSDISCAMAIVPVRIKHKNSINSIETYAFFDSGSSVSFCTEKVMKGLNLHGIKRQITLQTMGNPYEMETYALDDIQISDLSMTNIINMPRVSTKEEMPVSKNHIPTKNEINRWSHLKDVEISEIDAEIGLMIGNNVPDAYAPLKVITGPSGSPHATKTRVGWIVWNVLRNRDKHEVNRVAVESFVESDKRLEEMVKKSINMDFPERVIDDKREHSLEDKMFLNQVEDSITLKDGHYSVSLPLRSPSVKFPDNYMQAMQRLKALEKRLRRDEKFKSDDIASMMKLFEKGYAEAVPIESKEKEGRVWYIPHHGIYHHKKLDKIRVVFDCSVSYMGSSLNGKLLQGPDMTNNLLGVLLRFRKERIAVQGDIEAMFHQVTVPEQDRDLLRFLWWKDGDIDSEPQVYRMRSHIFGATSSPSCCNFALKRLALDHKDAFDLSIVDAVQRKMYVDDCLASLATVPEAISFIKDISALCMKGSFHLNKWVSNSMEVLESIPEEDRAKNAKNLIIGGQSTSERALGVSWFIEDDKLGFQTEMRTHPFTRRGLLSIVSSVYDPLGIAAPFVLSAKSLLQSLCKEGKKWDEPISDKHLKIWQNWVSHIDLLRNLRIERCLKPKDFGEVSSYELHCFSDASEAGIGVVIYLRIKNSDGSIHCAFVLGRSRVAPLKTVTIPRMELTAATASVRLSKMVTEELDLPIKEIFYWTDSTSVLKYIANTSLRFKTFVANRLAIIHEATDITQWHHVRSKENPADCASRGMSRMDKLLENDKWLQGPDYLWEKECEWPESKMLSVDTGPLERDAEVKGEISACSLKTESDIHPIDHLLYYYSDWTRLRKATAYLLHGMNNLKKFASEARKMRKEMSCSGSSQAEIENRLRKERKGRLSHQKKDCLLTIDTFQRAENLLISHVQKQAFESDIIDLHNRKRVKRSSRIVKLDPIMDHGILRVGGRLEQSDIAYEAKHPIILPRESPLSKLIVCDAHKSNGHFGKNATLSFIQQRFWILGASDLAKSVISKCATCKRYQGSVMKQKLANLPKERLVADKPPFSHTGMDYFGPFELKRGRSLVKRYGVIFTCMTSRAIHLEVATSLDTDSCINAIRRFIARRGKPELIRSDNGTNLVGAEKELRQSILQFNSAHIHNHLLQKGIEWQFNPPSASHFGGVWERLIRSVRKVLYTVLHEQVINLDDEGLNTLFCEVEAILNARPLTKASNSTNDLDVLTPNHILLLRPGENFAPGIFMKTDNYVRRRWRQIQYLADLFWTRWTKDYLPLLQSRQKWLKAERNVRVGDIVLIADSTPRNKWNLGRIIEVQTDKHDLVRVAKVKTASTTLVRPIAKLCMVLESDLK